MYIKDIVPAIKNGLNAAVLTQVSDVEDEINGLVTYDRKVCKVDEMAMWGLSANLQGALTKKKSAVK